MARTDQINTCEDNRLRGLWSSKLIFSFRRWVFIELIRYEFHTNIESLLTNKILNEMYRVKRNEGWGTDYMLLNMLFDILGMIIDTPYYAMSSFLNSLGRYKELSIISIIAVTIRIFASSIRSIYAVNIGMLTSACIQIILTISLFLYYKHKYRTSIDN